MNKILRRLSGLKCPKCGVPQPLSVLNTMVGSEEYVPAVRRGNCEAWLRVKSKNGVFHFLLLLFLMTLPLPFLALDEISINLNNPEGLFNWPLSSSAKSVIFYIIYFAVVVLPISNRALKLDIYK
ncbi:hypothetical protein [Ruegeria sp. HKCCSP351]|uniref:hypothetical protein n=1 Tax=Ruegeria sp. HKCCSP351 TaxID=2794832 RepID=UPI001AE26FAC|nr:hypothetical protein [Ruegeria sp. HKCCSP351]